jgi:hypothetical protein
MPSRGKYLQPIPNRSTSEQTVTVTGRAVPKVTGRSSDATKASTTAGTTRYLTAATAIITRRETTNTTRAPRVM